MSSRVGTLLVKASLITEDQLIKAQEYQTSHGVLLGTALVALGFVEEETLLSTISSQYGISVIKLEDLQVEPEILKLVPQKLANKHLAIPLKLENSVLTIAMADPSNILAINDIKFLTGFDIQVALTNEKSLKTFLEKLYEGDISYDNIIGEVDTNDMKIVDGEEQVDIQALEKATEDAPVVKLVNAILMDAVKKGASDIHIEPYEKVFRVRFRIDGVLYEIMKPPLKLKNALTSRIKVMADLDIAERRLPQDGRIKMKMGNGKEMDFRVSVLPGLFGEKVVMRLLDKSNLQTDMLKLGFDEVQLRAFKEAIYKPYGLVLVTGPTGSGKTTTLYSALSEL
ncbi:Flp pilus assembly complex ATPase component TadA, partial [bacterium]|nr:Flp pilus assembly complex ATPase component TadA [bacterium]